MTSSTKRNSLNNNDSLSVGNLELHNGSVEMAAILYGYNPLRSTGGRFYIVTGILLINRSFIPNLNKVYPSTYT